MFKSGWFLPVGYLGPFGQELLLSSWECHCHNPLLFLEAQWCQLPLCKGQNRTLLGVSESSAIPSRTNIWLSYNAAQKSLSQVSNTEENIFSKWSDFYPHKCTSLPVLGGAIPLKYICTDVKQFPHFKICNNLGLSRSPEMTNVPLITCSPYQDRER